MRRLLVALAAVALLLGGYLVYLKNTGTDLDLQAIADCRQPLVHPEPVADEADFDTPLALEPVMAAEGTIAMDRWTDGRLVVAIRTGTVVLLADDGRQEEVLDVSDRIELNAEGGILGLAVDPSGEHVYVHHTDLDGTSHVLSYAIDDGELVVDSERDLLQQPHPGLVHNGGNLVFGPDGMLYLGFGDGSLKVADAIESDSRDTLAAKVLRIDPTPGAEQPYAIPADNPDPAGERGRPEIWLEGVRNPWRFSFDRETGELWIGDVGNDCWEEIDVVAPGESDVHFGWPRYEGVHALASDEDDGETRFPIHTIRHGDSCAIIGGVVYRGSAIPELTGRYVYQDLCEGQLRAIERTDGGTRGGMLGVEQFAVIAFWEDEAGELYVLTAMDGIFRLVAGDAETTD